MTPQFHQHPEGLIYVRGLPGTYVATAQQFAREFGEAVPGLPAGYLDRVYEPGVRHAVSNGSSVISGELPWTFGDRVIKALPVLLKKQTQRE